jgi:hypothetical protein
MCLLTRDLVLISGFLDTAMPSGQAVKVRRNPPQELLQKFLRWIIHVYFKGSPAYWRSKRQPIVTMSSTEAELVALTELSLQFMLLKNLAKPGL